MLTHWGTVIALSASLVMPTVVEWRKDGWIRGDSPHFVVVTDGTARDAIGVARRFERLRTAFAMLWPTARLDTRRVIVVATADSSRLRALMPPAWSSPSAAHAAGCAVTGLDRVYLAVPTHETSPIASVATHEYVHLLIDANLPQAPLWLNEGLAEFFATGGSDGRVMSVGRPNVVHLEVLRTERWLPLRTLLALDRQSREYVDARTAPVVYAQAWALVHFLKLADGGRHAGALTTYGALLAKGVNPVSAAETAFGGLSSMEAQLRAYARGSRFYDARLEDLPITPQPVATVALQPSEAALMLGDFLTHVDRYAEADRLLEQAGSLGGVTADVCERRALLEFLRRDLRAAAEASDCAIGLDPSRPLAHYLRAMSLMARPKLLTPDTVRVAEALLRRTLRLQPAFSPAYSALGGLLAARDGPSFEALALIERAIALDPFVPAHQVALGQVTLLTGDAKAAQRIAERARAIARTTTERELVDQLLRSALASAPP